MSTNAIPEALRLKNQLCFALYSTSRSVTRAYRGLLEELGVTYPQYLALLVLWESDGVSVGELAEALELEPATVTPLVKRLERLELVRRERSAEDERRVEIHLTDLGIQRRSLVESVPETLGCALGVDPEEALDLINRLNELKAQLNSA